MRLKDQCSFPSAWCVLLCTGSVYEGISRMIKRSHSHAVIHFVIITVHIQIQTYESTAMLILCFRSFVVAFTFVIRICITYKWNLSFMLSKMPLIIFVHSIQPEGRLVVEILYRTCPIEILPPSTLL